MRGRRSTQLVVIGVSVFVIGAGLVFLGMHANAQKRPVVHAPAAAAPSGAKVIDQGPSSNAAPIVIPKGLEAVAVKLDHVAGLAGYAKPGDRINLFATVKAGPTVGGLQPPYTKLVLGDVPVLAVTGATPGTDEGDPTYLLAVGTTAAERIIFYDKFESLWATLVPPANTTAPTSGRDYANALSR
jgi:hypothetical protein